MNNITLDLKALSADLCSVSMVAGNKLTRDHPAMGPD